MESLQKSFLKFILVVCLLQLYACSNVQEVKIKDRSTQQPNISVSHKFNERWSLEASHAYTEGQERQALDGPSSPSSLPDSIRLDDIVINGPARLENEVKVNMTKLGVGLTALDKPRIKLLARFGFSQYQVDIDFDAGQNVFKYSDDQWGMYGDFSVILPITQRLQAFATAGINRYTEEDSIYFQEQIIGLSWSPATAISFNLGYYEWNFNDDRDLSDLSLYLRGVSLGLQLNL